MFAKREKRKKFKQGEHLAFVTFCSHNSLRSRNTGSQFPVDQRSHGWNDLLSVHIAVVAKETVQFLKEKNTFWYKCRDLIFWMANIAVSRVKREFREVVTSEEVSCPAWQVENLSGICSVLDQLFEFLSDLDSWVWSNTLNKSLTLAFLYIKAQNSTIKLELVGDSFTRLKGEIAGPPDTPFEG